MHLEIVTPDKNIYTGTIKLIQVPGSKGQFEVLRNHAAIISTLNAGKIKVVDHEDKKTYFDIKGGVIDVNNNHIIVLAEI